jgi:hypothetical protein
VSAASSQRPLAHCVTRPSSAEASVRYTSAPPVPAQAISSSSSRG